jgi:4-amino-4-deoxy-L-arabinose transferase-like glycosyltransferase
MTPLPLDHEHSPFVTLTSPQPNFAPATPAPSARGPRWRASSISLIFLVWAILQFGGLFTPGLLDDVDSIYIQIAREMLQRHDFVTPTIDGIRFFDKPPLMYWMAAGSMHVFGVHDWAARLPLALGVLALFFAVYALGNRLFIAISPSTHPDRGGLYAALAMATSLGPYLYTRFYIPDILIALWMALSVHLFLIAMDRITTLPSGAPSLHSLLGTVPGSGPLLPMLGFAAVLALSVLTKGLIGLVFPVLFVLLYLAITRNFRALAKLHLIASTAFFLLIAAPWHILAALRNPAISMPAGVGLPAHAGWAWFYLYNEHIARFLGRRIPHDYGQVPIPIFWLLLLLWLLPWVAFLPGALLDAIRELRSSPDSTLRFDSDSAFSHESVPTTTSPSAPSEVASLRSFVSDGWGSLLPDRRREAALSLLLWAGVILGFFTLSSRQEYYHLPALPALALLVGGLLAAADAQATDTQATDTQATDTQAAQFARLTQPSAIQPRVNARRQVMLGSFYFLVPLGALLFVVCGYFALTAPQPHPGVTLNDVLSSNPALYNLSLGHVFDLTGQAMGFFRGPLLAVALCMLALGPISHLIRRRGSNSRTANVSATRSFIANLLVAAAMTGVLLAAHEGLVRFYPILGSKALALDIDTQLKPGDRIVIDGELTAGSTLLFYTPQRDQHVLLVDGRKNGPWFGSFWPDAPHIFLDDNGLRQLWAGPHRIFLLTYDPASRAAELSRFSPVTNFANSGGKTILTNQRLQPQ